MATENLFSLIMEKNRDRQKVFIFKDDDISITYGQVSDLAAKFANTLVNLGVERGDRVLVYAEKSVENMIVYLACLRAGFIYLPINPAYTQTELEYFIEDSLPKVIICSPNKADIVQIIGEKFKVSAVETLGTDGKTGSFLEKAGKSSMDFADVICTKDDIAAIVYTSGTTGRSKGAMITHGNLYSNAMALCETWKFSQDDVLLHALPIFHVHGLFVATNVALVSGSSMIFLPAFDVDEIINHLSGATVMMGVPTFYTLLLQNTRLTRELVGHMRLFISGSAPLLAEIHRQWSERTGHQILERYGMTETGMIASNPYEEERVPGTVGFPLVGISLRITDQSSGNLLPDGEIGLIEVKGPNVFKGYWHMPEKTREDFREDNFFITGDLGFIDERGYLHIVGRQKDMIITCGLNVYPKEIEEKINGIAGVVESAIVGVPHKEFGEGVIGVVVIKKNVNLSEKEILIELKKELAQYKVPLKIIFVDMIPRNTMGKVQKSILRSSYNNLFI